MSKHGSIRQTASAALFGVLLLSGGAAVAQTNTPPPSPQTTTPNAETPPGGIARGVVPPAHNVDPQIVTKPPADLKPTMPVIKPPAAAR